MRRRSDGKGWLVDAGLIGGKRVRLSFPTRPEAEGELARLRAEQRREGDRVAGLSPEQRARWLALEDRCREAGGTLEEAVDHWLAHRPGPGAAALGELLPGWLADTAETRGDRHRYQVALHWRDFEAEVSRWIGGGTADAAHLVTAAHVERHLGRPDWSAGTRRSRLASVSCLLGWAARRGLVPRNVAALVHKPELPVAGEIRFLTVAEARALLRSAAGAGEAARDVVGRDVVVYLVLGMFAGVRVREIERAVMGDLHLDTAEFVVPLGKVSARSVAGRRSRKRRVVDLEITALEWLRWAGVEALPPDLPVCGPNFRKRWEAVRAVVADWPENALRHTYATYHYALHRDEARLQALMGHDSKDVLHSSYRGLARRGDAVAFWESGPDTVGLPGGTTGG